MPKLLLPRAYKLRVLMHRMDGQIRVYKRPDRRSFSRYNPTGNQGGLSRAIFTEVSYLTIRPRHDLRTTVHFERWVLGRMQVVSGDGS
jgi:hypothetical protein